MCSFSGQLNFKKMRIKYITVILIVGTAFWGLRCNDLNRSNPLDPANPKSARIQVALIEAFVNDSAPFSPFALEALTEIASQLNENKFLILEYHLPSQSYPDTLASPAAKARYDFYVTQDQAVPDIFIDGLRHRIQGAASKSTALKQYQAALTLERHAISHFTIEASSLISDNEFFVEISIARLGEEEFSNFSIRAVAFEDTGEPGHHFVVRSVLPSETIPSIDAGGQIEVTLSTLISAGAKLQHWQVVVFIQQNSNKEILQSVLAN